MLVRSIIIAFLFISSVAPAQTITVHFDFNSAVLSNDTRAELDKIIASRKTKDLGVFGHTDPVGTDEYNEWLSVKRAKAVKDYLLSRGLDQSKISVVRGFGATRLISSAPDSISMRLNRRVALTNGYKPTAMDTADANRQAKINLFITPSLTGKKPVANSESTSTATTTTPVKIKKEEPVVKQQKNEKLVEDIKDKTTKAGEHIVLKNINFYAGSHEFLPAAFPSLQDLLEAMQKIPTLQIEIQGHVCCQDDTTDAIDNATNELSLSVNRAKAVYNYLVDKGINKDRLSYKGLAHQYPLIKIEATEEDRITNRRVEIKIIKK